MQSEAGSIEALVGSEVGLSPWLEIDQDRIDRFGLSTNDPDPMHIDPDWCFKNSPYGTPIAFGFLTLSLLTFLVREAIPWPRGAYALNYGFDRVRLMSPVRVGDSIRGRFDLAGVEPRPPGKLFRFAVTVEIKDNDKPALVADWLALVVNEEPPRHGQS